MHDFLVVGGGLAGTTAALALAAGGAKVALARAGWGATATCTGALELGLSPALSALGGAQRHGAGAPGQGGDVEPGAALAAPWPWRRHLEDIVAHEVLHPYAVLGMAGTASHLQGGYALLRAAVAAGGLALPELSLDAPCALLPSAQGTLVPTAAALQPAGAGACPWRARAPQDRWAVLDLSAAGAPLGPRSVLGWRFDAERFGVALPALQTVVAPIDAAVPHGPMALAAHLDDLAAAERLFVALRPALQAQPGCTGVVVPAVLGLRRHAQVHALATRIWGMPVHEAQAMLPSVPGARLMLALEAAAQAAGIRLVSPVAQVHLGGAGTDATTTAQTLHDGTLQVGALVLATGRHLGGGLVWPPGATCREALLGLPVRTAHGPLLERTALELTARRPEAPQPLLSAGVAVDAAMRPLDARGEPLAQVRAVGMLVGGFSPRDGRCRDGVALASAHAAARSLLGGRP